MPDVHGAAASAASELVITRTFDAPVGLVFQAWARPEHQMHWMGPKGFTVLSCEIDFRAGGSHRTCILSPEGIEYAFHGTYREIVEDERLVFSFAWEEEGERGEENLVTLEFAEHAGRTRMSFHQAPFRSVAERDGHHGGWSECFDRLAAFLQRQLP